jgi:hypothetical protein
MHDLTDRELLVAVFHHVPEDVILRDFRKTDDCSEARERMQSKVLRILVVMRRYFSASHPSTQV